MRRAARYLRGGTARGAIDPVPSASQLGGRRRVGRLCFAPDIWMIKWPKNATFQIFSSSLLTIKTFCLKLPNINRPIELPCRLFPID